MTIESAFKDLNNAILDLQHADHNTYERPVKKMAVALDNSELQAINKKLKDNVDFENFIENSYHGSSMVGSAQLNWPLERELELGLTLHIIEKSRNDPHWLQNFAFEWYYDGNKIISSLRKLNRSVFIPFARDYKDYIAKVAPKHEIKSHEVEALNLVDRVEENREPILFVSKLIITLTEELREKVRGDNKLSPVERTAALEVLDKIQKLSQEAQTMSETPPDLLMSNDDIQSWTERFKSAINESIDTIIDPKNLANAAVPTGLILGCGALGAMIGGPLGFGAGSMLGHLITGQIKPGAAAKTIQDAVSDRS
ncbi:hypothetical protein [Sulfitobacter sp. PM12]|uniref:hypothetical protein n=1 Tax=Sulfitobacter sp. PM12 TaxID=3138497 RepID=UPI00388F485C